jgi:MATE family multidrug resistance protein
VTEPLIGVVNTAIIGQLPDPTILVQLPSVPSFSFIFWVWFLRLSTGGLSAQAVGAGDVLNSPLSSGAPWQCCRAGLFSLLSAP